jgi:hypothetical protein
MKDISKIWIGKHLFGIIGLKETIADVANKHREISDDQIGKILLGKLLKDNYIEKRMEEIYKNAFMREYKKFMGVPVVEEAGEGVDIKVFYKGGKNGKRRMLCRRGKHYDFSLLWWFQCGTIIKSGCGGTDSGRFW